MKVRLTLEGKQEAVQEVISFLVGEGVVVSFEVTESNGHLPKARKISTECSFKVGDDVYKAYQTAGSPVPRFTPGKVKETRRNRTGYAVLVEWNDECCATDWIAASQLALQTAKHSLLPPTG